MNTEPIVRRSIAQVATAEQTIIIGLRPNHFMFVRYSFDPVVKRMEAGKIPIYDWGAEFTIPGGGLLERTDLRDRVPETMDAPLEGYQETISWRFTGDMNEKQYTIFVNRDYFVKFQDGTYGRIHIEMEASPTRPWLHVESYHVPNGSRHTEYDKSKEIPVP